MEANALDIKLGDTQQNHSRSSHIWCPEIIPPGWSLFSLGAVGKCPSLPLKRLEVFPCPPFLSQRRRGQAAGKRSNSCCNQSHHWSFPAPLWGLPLSTVFKAVGKSSKDSCNCSHCWSFPAPPPLRETWERSGGRGRGPLQSQPPSLQGLLVLLLQEERQAGCFQCSRSQQLCQLMGLCVCGGGN